MEITILGNHFQLLPERAVFWKEKKALILADLHIGKTMHFRKEGIAVPKNVFDEDLECLNSLVQKFSPTGLIISGDMFHSHHNNEIKLFEIWRAQYDELRIDLVRGNHDILAASRYKDMDIHLTHELCIDGFIFLHILPDECHKFCFYGHLHPGIRINGMAKQSLKFPCFHFTENSCTLPAFSKFTGCSLIKPKKGDRVFAIYENEVTELF